MLTTDDHAVGQRATVFHHDIACIVGENRIIHHHIGTIHNDAIGTGDRGTGHVDGTIARGRESAITGHGDIGTGDGGLLAFTSGDIHTTAYCGRHIGDISIIRIQVTAHHGISHTGDGGIRSVQIAAHRNCGLLFFLTLGFGGINNAGIIGKGQVATGKHRSAVLNLDVIEHHIAFSSLHGTGHIAVIEHHTAGLRGDGSGNVGLHRTIERGSGNVAGGGQLCILHHSDGTGKADFTLHGGLSTIEGKLVHLHIAGDCGNILDIGQSQVTLVG